MDGVPASCNHKDGDEQSDQEQAKGLVLDFSVHELDSSGRARR